MRSRLLIVAVSAACVLLTVDVAQADELPDLSGALKAARSHGGDGWLRASGTDLSLEGAGLGQPLPDPEPCAPCCLKWDVKLLAWLSGLSGDIGIDGQDAEIDLAPWDLLNLAEYVTFFLEGRVAATYGNWLFFAGGMALGIGDSIDVSVAPPTGGPGTDVDAELDFSLTIVELGVGYCLGKCVTGHDCCGRETSRTGYAYVGARYFAVDMEFDSSLAFLPESSSSESFVDPIIGGAVMWELGGRWAAEIDADIGGFGVGSDFSWRARAAMKYRFTQSFYGELGYMVLDIDAERGSSFKWDVTMYGPYLGVGFRF